jgi:Ca2+-binding EF-hand superfamily protein
MKPFIFTALVFAVSWPLSAQRLDQHDRNGDGMVTRAEWRGNNRSFQQHDRNRDGVLSGDELSDVRSDGNRGRAAGRLDKDRSGAVEGHEWPYNSNVFHELDKDGNSVLTNDELNNINSTALPHLDMNKDRRIDESEWPGGFAQFERLDQNGDGRISPKEYFDRGGEWQRRQRFDSWDTNRNGVIESNEWKTTSNLFRRLDTNRNSVVDWDEFMASTEQYDRPFGWR